jgi:hypothetical protein
MRIKALLFFLLITFGGVLSAQNKDLKEIYNFLREEERRWNAADLAGYVEMYLPEAETRMLTKKGAVKGKAQILEYYTKYFPKDNMGQLTLEADAIEKMNKNTYYVTGFFHLTYADGKKVDGRYSSLMKKVNGKWYIYTDHSS